MRTNSGKTFNMRGLQHKAGSNKYEFAHEMEGVGVNHAGDAATPNATGARARRIGARQRGRNNG